MANEKKMLGPRTTLLWIDAAALTTPMSPLLSEITAALADDPPTAINASCTIVTGYTMNPTDSDTDDSKLLCDAANVQTRAASNYEGSLQFARERNPLVNTDSIFIPVYDKFKKRGAEGYWIRRVGKEATEPFVVGDIVDVFKFISDSPRDIESDSGGPIYLEVPFLPQGVMAIQVLIADDEEEV